MRPFNLRVGLYRILEDDIGYAATQTELMMPALLRAQELAFKWGTTILDNQLSVLRGWIKEGRLSKVPQN